MKIPTILAAMAVAFLLLTPASHAQVGFSVQIGPPPVCPYGYYPVPPYNCAPYGYYGPAWFNDGIFIGAGPWFHGPRDFHGWVDNHYDWDHYHGAYPHRGDRDRWEDNHWHGHPDGYRGFHGNEMRDGRGHVEHGDHGDHHHDEGHPHN
jgi:hypothetical protein